MSFQFSIVGTTYDDKLFGNLNNVSIANAFRNIGNHFQGVAVGAISEMVITNAGPVNGSGTISIAVGNMSDADTITINSVVLTAKTTPVLAGAFKIGSSALLTAINLAAYINSYSLLNTIVRASYAKSSTTGVVTVTALGAGTAGNYAWSQSGSNVTLAGASAMTGGANGPVSATATVTIATTGPTNSETMTICNQTFTAETSGAVPASGQFNISATAATVAANLALAVNSVVALQGIVTATHALGVVTITSVVPGLVGNGLQIANGNLANTTVVAFGGSGTVSGINANYVTLHKGI